jgi:dihydrofolate synthase/folylpolyglutamate synthase
MRYSEAVSWLFEQFPAYHNLGKDAYNPGLKNTAELCAFFGNPHHKLRFVHVGGTNGKGSVSNMTASILTETGETVGLFTSPHLFDFTERIRVNGEPIDEAFVVEFCKTVKQQHWKIVPSFFEITWVMALSYFEKKQCSIVVAEVGLGGRLDATNIITPLVSVITNISIEHTNLLGNTKREIAIEKAGIIKATIPVVIGERDEETLPVFQDKAMQCNSPMFFPNTEATIPTELLGYQQFNFQIVVTVCELLEQAGIPCTTEKRLLGIRNLRKNTGFWGRLERISSSPLILADCAHNAAGIQALFASLSDINHGKLHLIYGTSADKDLEAILPLFPLDANYYFTTFSNPRSIKLDSLIEKTQLQFKNANYFSSATEALKKAQTIANKEDTILIFGSFFLLHDFFEVFFQKGIAQNKI